MLAMRSQGGEAEAEEDCDGSEGLVGGNGSFQPLGTGRSSAQVGWASIVMCVAEAGTMDGTCTSENHNKVSHC